MKSLWKKNNKHLFTLVEVIAAMTVMMFVVMIIGTASSTYYRSWKTGVQITERLKEYRNIDMIADTLIRNLIQFHWTDEDNESESDLVFGGEVDQLMFTALRRSYSGDSGSILFVRLRLDDSDLIAEYSFEPRFPWVEIKDETYPWKREVLARNVRELSFRYADKTTDNAVEWLDEEWDNTVRPAPPLAIRMTVVWEDGHSMSWLRRTAGSGANSVYQNREEVMANASTDSNAQILP